MTTIATDGQTMAADGLRKQHGAIIDTDALKLRRLSDGRIVGTCGDVAEGEMVVEWLEAGGGKDDKPTISDDTVALVLNLDGTVEIYDHHCRPIRVPAPIAIGSGCEFAMGALDAGASPQKAVVIATRRDPNSGGRISVMSLMVSRVAA
jgi:ATP-dependent HslUV protease subunit HslV